ncbi:TetR family transcriptional regulator [Rathayibacter sp. PhB151]|uniref:TetR/AcrR family transcriptional regulator n=1 Tax=Rathayibacter sp. PhB151 TaxID=2485189 RepID=UPI0010633068|nr:TetR/AcrR family transcriptional regulator [Rathayibacter sp. PhB151]TDX77294.1 TetR family transcriptional regulator [Rathayibacter sp. PhB151]
MSTALPSAAPGRRERNKLAKLERITAAASELFAEHGVDEVTTQQIAERADIGTGTLFLYARTKSELLLLVQNAHYAEALERGRAAAADAATVLDAVLALVAPIVACNRAHVGNGRVYLREMVFGDPAEPHHAEARSIVGRSEEAIAGILERGGVQAAATVAGVVSAVVFVTLAASDEPDVAAILPAIRAQLAAVLPA